MIILRLEKSKSRTGKHAVRTLAFYVTSDGRVLPARPRSLQPVKPLYRVGEAYEAWFEPPSDGYLVYVRLLRNLRGHVKGYIEVYSRDAELLYRAVYRKLKLRRSSGDPSYAWVVRRVAEHLGLPVKNTNLGDEGGGRRGRRGGR